MTNPSTRRFRPQKAGCVPVLRRRSERGVESWQVLLIQSSLTPEIWIFPKGGVEEGETSRQAAARETVEESGVTGLIGPKLGCWNLTRSGKQKHSMWILFVTTQFDSDSMQWKERSKRQRAWHSFGDARAIFNNVSLHLKRPELLEMLQAAEAVVTRVIQIGQLPLLAQHCDESDEEHEQNRTT